MENENEKFNPNLYWEAVKKSWPDSKVIEGQRGIDLFPKVCVVLCPLYAKGPLEDSRLIGLGETIQDSRVAGKFEAYVETVKALHGVAGTYGGRAETVFVFANKGTLVDPRNQGVDALLPYHQQLYENELRERLWLQNINFQLFNYDDMGVDFPTCVDLKSWPEGLKEPEGNLGMAMLKSFQTLLNLSHSIPTNNDSRKVVKDIVGKDNIGYVSAFWIIAGYLAFDGKIHGLIGDRGIYVMAERMSPLFWIHKLTPSLKEVNKILLYA